VVRLGGFVPAVVLGLFFVSGFLALKIPAPAPTSAPTSCPNAVAPATKLKTITRRIALVLIDYFSWGFKKENLWITEELLCWIVDQLRLMELILSRNTSYKTYMTYKSYFISRAAHQPES
jgi:hypothetical protein